MYNLHLLYILLIYSVQMYIETQIVYQTKSHSIPPSNIAILSDEWKCYQCKTIILILLISKVK